MLKDTLHPIDFKAVFSSSITAMCVLQHRTILTCNAAAAALFDYSPDAMVGKSCALLYPSDAEFERFGSYIHEAIETTGMYLGERIMRRCHGELFWCRARGVAITDGNGLEIWTFTEVGPQSEIYKLLSPREREVATMLAAGNTSKMMASKLGLSIRTVEFYRRGLMQKITAHSFSHLAKLFSRCDSDSAVVRNETQ